MPNTNSRFSRYYFFILNFTTTHILFPSFSSIEYYDQYEPDLHRYKRDVRPELPPFSNSISNSLLILSLVFISNQPLNPDKEEKSTSIPLHIHYTRISPWFLDPKIPREDPFAQKAPSISKFRALFVLPFSAKSLKKSLKILRKLHKRLPI